MPTEVPDQLVTDTIKGREPRYGNFTTHSAMAIRLKETMRTASNWEKLSADKKHALDMMSDKIARILNGDPEYKDNWHDIAGYATLAEQRCKGAE